MHKSFFANNRKYIVQILCTALLLLLQLFQIRLIAENISVIQFAGYGLAIVIFNIFFNLGDRGVTSYLIHKYSLSNYDGILRYSLTFAVSTYIVLLLLIPLWNSVFSFGSFEDVLPFILLSLIFYGLGSISQSLLLNKNKSEIVALVDVAARFLSLATLYFTIEKYKLLSAALCYSEYWLIRTVTMIFLTRDQFSFKDSILNKLESKVNISEYTNSFVISQLINTSRSQADVLVVGIFFGNHVTGLYTLTKQVVNLPSQILKPILQRIILPIISKVAADSISLVNKIYSTSSALVLFVASVFAFFIFMPTATLNIIAGEQYLEAQSILIVMSITACLRLSVGGLQSTISQAIGKTKIELKWSFYILPLQVLFLCSAFILNDILTFLLFLLVYQTLASLLSTKFFLKRMIPRLNEIKYTLNICFIFTGVSLISSLDATLMKYLMDNIYLQSASYWFVFITLASLTLFSIKYWKRDDEK